MGVRLTLWHVARVWRLELHYRCWAVELSWGSEWGQVNGYGHQGWTRWTPLVRIGS